MFFPSEIKNQEFKIGWLKADFAFSRRTFNYFSFNTSVKKEFFWNYVITTREKGKKGFFDLNEGKKSKR